MHRIDAPFTYARRVLEQQPDGKRLLEADPQTLTDPDRARLVRMFTTIEADKEVIFVEEAAMDLERRGVWTQDLGLKLRRAVLDAAASFDSSNALALLGTPASPERDVAISAQAEVFSTRLAQAVPTSLAAMNLPAEQTKAFETVMAAARAERAATEDLADEKWEVRVQMPGTVTEHNADAVEDGVLVWRFSAIAINDRDQVCRATSVLPPGTGR